VSPPMTVVSTLAVLALLSAAQEAKPASPPASTATAEPSTAGAAPLDRVLAEADAAYDRRDEADQLAILKARLEEADRDHPNDYAVLWRLARMYAWTSDDPAITDKEKSKLGKEGWDLGERAIAADPTRVEGWHYCAINMGQYSLGIGILTALAQGIEGKFKDRLSHAEKIDPKFSGGAIPTAWGRFWYKLPWPKYDARKSEAAFREALRINPDNVRARVYLADLYGDEGHDDEARKQLEKAAAGEPGRYDAPEERRYQDVARKRLAHVEKR